MAKETKTISKPKKWNWIKVTMKQKIFTDEYLKTGNKTKAAMKAYKVKNYNTAAAIGSENLKKPNIIQYFQENSNIAAAYMTSVIENPNDKTSFIA